MKYVVIIVVLAIFVRLDFVLTLFERAMLSMQPKTRAVQTSEVKTFSDVVPFAEDKNLKQTPKSIFLSLMQNFHVHPESSVRERAMAELKANPSMFGAKLDKDLEQHVYRWRDLLHQGDNETAQFLLDLMQVLQGENLDMLKRFFSIMLDVRLPEFMTYYSRSKDTNCLVASVFGEVLPEEEKINELIDREKSVNEFLARTDLEANVRSFAQNCQLVLRVQISKVIPPETVAPAQDPAINPVPAIPLPADPAVPPPTPGTTP